MSEVPQVSLVLSCYNQKSWMNIVVRSALSQRVEVPYEVIVCDDGSSDDTFSAVRRSCVGSTIEVRYIWQPDRGFRLSASRNNAIRCARGELIVFVDGDSWLSPTCLQDHWRAHREPSVLVCGGRVTLNVTEAALNRLNDPQLDSMLVARPPETQRQAEWLRTDSPWMACLGGNFSASRSAELYFDERFQSWGSEDRDLAFRLYRSGLRPKLLDRANVVHLQSPGDSFWEMDSDAVAEFIRNKAILHAKYPGRELEPSVSLVRHCHLDPARRQWFMGSLRTDVSVTQVFEEFAMWSFSQ